MKNRFLKGLSVALAAALALGAIPATQTEAASKKTIYVVTEATDNNGGVTKYTYDKRGRIVKEVYTISTEGSASNVSAGTNKAVTGTATKVKNIENTTVYTYNSSGKAKDKKARAVTTNVVVIGYKYDSSEDSSDTGYIASKVSTAETTYKYNSKGQLIDQWTKSVSPNNYTYSNLSGWAARTAVATVDNKFANSKSFANDVTTTDTEIIYNYNSTGLEVRTQELKVINSHDENYAVDNRNAYTGAKTVVDTQTAQIGDMTSTTYNSKGLPTKKSTTNDGNISATVTTNSYNPDGSLNAAASGKKIYTANIANGGYDYKTSKISTTTYSYDTDGNFEKMVVNGTQGTTYFTINGEEYAYDNNLKITTKTESGEVYSMNTTKTTYTFEYGVKSGTNRMKWQSVDATAQNSDRNTGLAATSKTKFKLKKMSVPSAAATKANAAQYQLTNMANVDTVTTMIEDAYASSLSSLLANGMDGAEAL